MLLRWIHALAASAGLAICGLACSRGLTIGHPAADARANAIDLAPARDATSAADADAPTQDQVPQCSLRANRMDVSFLTDLGACPATLAAIGSACADHQVKQTGCTAYVEVSFEPGLTPSAPGQYRSDCFYAVDSEGLLGGWVVERPFGEDAFPEYAGQTPVNCEETCTAQVLICSPDGGAPDSTNAAVD
jgi:hypothetical protein